MKAHPDLDEESAVRRRARQRWTIFAGVAFGTTSLFAAFTAAPLVAADIGASRALTGLPGTASVLGTALGSAFLSWLMARRGRRAGLKLGWCVGLAGAAGAGVAVSSSAFPGLLAAMVLIGIGHSANQLSRFAAADLAPPETRASAVGWVVWASTIGAVAGPTLLGVGERGAEALGFSTHAGGFLVTAVFYGAALVCALALRPEPGEIALGDADSSESGDTAGSRWLPHVRLAVVIMIVGQMTMVLIMTMTPIHVSEHGHSIGAVGFVMSSHLIGMYALAPVVGKVVARAGSVRVAIAGMMVLIVAAVAAAAAPPQNAPLVAGALFLLGLGWCLGFVAGSALLTRGLVYAERVQLQGRVDGLVWTSSALASLGSGILLATVGYAALSLIGAAAVVGPLVLVSVRGRAALAE